MGFERNVALVCAGVASLIGAAPAVCAPKEPLIVTQLRDPDPYFVPQPADGKEVSAKAPYANDENARIDEAMADFGRAIGQAAMVEQQQIEARCRSGLPETATSEQRFAWAASCRYTRR